MRVLKQNLNGAAVIVISDILCYCKSAKLLHSQEVSNIKFDEFADSKVLVYAIPKIYL